MKKQRVQWTGEPDDEMVDFLEETGFFFFRPDGTLEVEGKIANQGDWIVRNPNPDPEKYPDGVFRIVKEKMNLPMAPA